MKYLRSFVVAFGLLALSMSGANAATKLVINSGLTIPASKKALDQIVASFEKAHPDIDVQVNVYGHEAQKTAIRNWLVADPPDLVYWYPGTRMQLFVKNNLFANVSDLWNKLNFKEKTTPAVTQQLTWNGKQWGMPYTYYMWGIYYRKDIFKKYGIEVPKTWEDLLKAAATLKKNGVTPIALGDKQLWPAAGWFDYLDLRVNGYDFHMKLMHGKVKYTDPRVRDVFEHWAKLVEKGYFTENATSYGWQAAQRFLYNGKAGMFLIGSFIISGIPEDVKENIGFFRFPQINPDVSMAEEAPIDMFAVPEKAAHKGAAKKFLSYMVEPKNQTKLNRAMGQLPVVTAAKPPQGRLLKEQFKIMSEVEHISQFYDRDTKPAMAKVGMKQFQRFLANPDEIDSILKRLEEARKRIYGPINK